MRDDVVALDMDIDRIMDANRCFVSKDVTRFLEAYEMEMRKKVIPVARQVTSFSRGHYRNTGVDERLERSGGGAG